MSVKGSWSRIKTAEEKARYDETYDRIFCKHDFRFACSSTITMDGKTYSIDKFKCKLCKKLYVLDKGTNLRLDCKGYMGEEA